MNFSHVTTTKIKAKTVSGSSRGWSFRKVRFFMAAIPVPKPPAKPGTPTVDGPRRQLCKFPGTLVWSIGAEALSVWTQIHEAKRRPR